MAATKKHISVFVAVHDGLWSSFKSDMLVLLWPVSLKAGASACKRWSLYGQAQYVGWEHAFMLLMF